MKFWKVDRTENGCGEEGLILLDGDQDRVVSLLKNEDGSIVFTEECDGYFKATLSKTEAVAALIEAIEWIKMEKTGP